MAYGNVRKRLLRRNLVTRNLPTHHWALQQNQGLGKALREKFGDDVADRFINHPANLMPDIDPLLHGRAHNGSWLEYLRYGTPTWGKLGAAGIGSYSIGLGVDAE